MLTRLLAIGLKDTCLMAAILNLPLAKRSHVGVGMFLFLNEMDKKGAIRLVTESQSPVLFSMIASAAVSTLFLLVGCVLVAESRLAN